MPSFLPMVSVGSDERIRSTRRMERWLRGRGVRRSGHMETMRLKVTIPQSVALAAGQARYGETSYALTDQDVQSMTADEREWLAKHTGITIDSVIVSWDTVHAAITRAVEAEKAQKRKEEEEQARRYEEVVQRVLSSPRERLIEWVYDRIVQDKVASPTGFTAGTFHDIDTREDPRIAPIYAEVKAECERLNAEKTEQRRKREEAKQREEAEREASLERVRAELRAYALETDELARAAKDGYDVVSAVIDHVAQQVAALDEHAVILRDGSKEYDAAGWEDRKAPRASAFALLDRVTKHVATVRRPASVELEVSRIQRYRGPVLETDELGERRWTQADPCTAVLVYVSSPITKDRVVVFSAE